MNIKQPSTNRALASFTGSLLNSCTPTYRSKDPQFLTELQQIGIEAGKLDFEQIPFDLRTTLESLADLLAAKAQAKEVEFHLLIEPDINTLLLGDPGRLRQVLANLVIYHVKKY